MARKPEKAGQAKIRTFPLSRKPTQGWQAKIREIKVREKYSARKSERTS